MDPVLTATVIAMVVFTVRRLLVIGRACQRAAVTLVQQLPPGTRINARFGGAELQLLVTWHQSPSGRSETET